MRTLILFIGALISLQLGAVELQGQLIQGGLIHGKVAPGSRVELGEHTVKVAENGVFVAGFDRDAPAAMTLRVCHDGDCASQELAITQREYAVQRVNGVPQKTVTPPAEVLARIRQESAMVGKARRRSEDRQDFLNTYQWPLIGPITGVFGSQRVYNGTPGRPHYGVDVARPVGATVIAPNSGVVTLVHNDMFYSGGTLIVDHGQGISSTFIHLSKILVAPGQEVEKGQAIAEVGATGRATGPHLDWRMNWHGQRLDPALLVGPMPSELAPVSE
ncbi:M23 family metallopeptidase [Spongiibacter marinus]|uniref:M23 family metallopeptidase n=1 Tax=Spongiibacter marinus TaxID=354246 RepID=UPI003565BBC6